MLTCGYRFYEYCELTITISTTDEEDDKLLAFEILGNGIDRAAIRIF